jgi:type I restriction enzyme M protein
MSIDQKKVLENKLWGIANLLRGRVSADDYRDYILGFIFFKYLSEKQYHYANGLLEEEEIPDYLAVDDDESLEAIKEESILKLGYYLRPDQLFAKIVEKGNTEEEEEEEEHGQDYKEDDEKGNYILEDLENIMTHIEQSTVNTESEDDFNALFEDIDLHSTKLGRTVGTRNDIVVEILNFLDGIDFMFEDTESDILGDAYEFMIGKFAAGAGKSAGEFYTPQEVSTVLAKIVTTGKSRLRSVYDPTCGSGSLLLRVAREATVSEFFGQELTRTTYNLARMNMILHDVHFSQFDIQHNDTLQYPQHLGEQFEAIVANPPFSARWKGDASPLNATDERFSQYGRLAPKTKADYAFLTHMYYHLADDGIAASVFPHGVLFRGAAEGEIREYLIRELNAIDAIIGLPANIFFGTSIPTCIVVFKKCREAGKDVVFIDASGDEHFKKEGNQNYLRDKDIDKIVTAYRERKSIPKYCAVVPVTQIANENQYNLNIPRYVDTFETEERIDLDEVAGLLQELDKALAATNETIGKFCEELGIAKPF